MAALVDVLRLRLVLSTGIAKKSACPLLRVDEAKMNLHCRWVGPDVPRHSRLLVIDLARVERIDAGGLGVLLAVRELAGSRAITFKLMNATKNVKEILELTHLQRVFEFCSVRELFCLLHRAASMPSWSADQSNQTDENDSRNSSVEWPEALPAV